MHGMLRARSALAVTAIVLLIVVTGVVVVRRTSATPTKPAVAPLATPTQTPAAAPTRTSAPALRTPSLDPFAATVDGTRWHIRERRRVAWAAGPDAGAPSAVGLESWFYGCTSRTVVTSSSDPAMIGWELGGMAFTNPTIAPWYLGYLYDPVENVIYRGDRPRGNHSPWHTCGLGLAGDALDVPGGRTYLAHHGAQLIAPPDAALVDPRVAHPGARIREVTPATMDAIYLRAFHLRPVALGP